MNESKNPGVVSDPDVPTSPPQQPMTRCECVGLVTPNTRNLFRYHVLSTHRGMFDGAVFPIVYVVADKDCPLCAGSGIMQVFQNISTKDQFIHDSMRLIMSVSSYLDSLGLEKQKQLLIDRYKSLTGGATQ